MPTNYEKYYGSPEKVALNAPTAHEVTQSKPEEMYESLVMRTIGTEPIIWFNTPRDFCDWLNEEVKE